MVGDVFERLRECLRDEQPVALATIVESNPADTDPDAQGAGSAIGPVGPSTRNELPVVGTAMLVTAEGPPVGSLGSAGLNNVVARDALGQIDAGTTILRHYGPHGEARRLDVGVFIETFAPPPQMLIFGAVDFSAALARAGKLLGYRVTVCDARPVFATSERFPMADEVVVDWPHRHLAKVGPELSARDAICVLTHDPKFDVPALVGALGTAVGYIGAMGSRRTTKEREQRLREAGVDDVGLSRIMAPIGLDIGARTPEETAISICAEIVALRSGSEKIPSLRTADGPIHTSPSR